MRASPRDPPVPVAYRLGSGALNGGFSLIEVLISLAITLVVVALVIQTTRTMLRIYRAESRSVELTSMASRALDDMALEIARAGYGLGEGVNHVLAGLPGRSALSEGILLRSNAEGFSAELTFDTRSDGGELRLSKGVSLAPGDLVLVTDSLSLEERAEIAGIENDSIRLRSIEEPRGSAAQEKRFKDGSRILKLREVHYSVQSAPDGQVLVKEVRGSKEEGSRVLARRVEALRFEYLDPFGNLISPASPELSHRLSTVRVTLVVVTGSSPGERVTLRTAVTLDRQSAGVDFAEAGYGFRLARYFHPIERPAGLAMRSVADWGVFLSAGSERSRDQSYLYTFLPERRFLEARVESLTWLEDVRDPVALAFVPENSPLAGSLFIGSSGLRVGHLTRVHPDSHGLISSESQVSTLEGTNALAQIGGLAFGVDRALYIASSEKAKIFRIAFDSSGEPERLEAIAEVPGSPGAMVEGADGELYFIVELTGRSALWKVGFDDRLAPTGIVEVATLPGRGVSIAMEPLSGNLFVLLHERLGDFVIVELTRRWLREPQGELKKVFSLREFREKTQEGPLARAGRGERSPGMVLSQRLPTTLIPEKLDFVAFDQLGLLYLGAKGQDLVLKFDLDRLSTRHVVEVAGVVDVGRHPTSTEPRARLHAWRKTPFTR